ncbi:2Fe-2S iron-sulfur cluster-binding protein [Streptomyces sp. NPDC093249]|uniref:2Fe-2S iron-sulfur cluster-binding protein n=1 Tax=unclassified Streptomyces TaxID=2593676 RepID=UPI003829B621
MSNEQQGNQGGSPGGWEPIPQSEGYDGDATAFVQLPPDFMLEGVPLEAPGHGYVPPMITPLQPLAPMAPDGAAATGGWSAHVPAQAEQPPYPEQVPYFDASGYGGYAERTAPYPAPPGQGDPHATAEWHFPETTAPDPGATGQWTVPDAPRPDEGPGGFAASAVRPYAEAPATLPGGAPAPWALPEEPAPALPGDGGAPAAEHARTAEREHAHPQRPAPGQGPEHGPEHGPEYGPERDSGAALTSGVTHGTGAAPQGPVPVQERPPVPGDEPTHRSVPPQGSAPEHGPGGAHGPGEVHGPGDPVRGSDPGRSADALHGAGEVHELGETHAVEPVHASGEPHGAAETHGAGHAHGAGDAHGPGGSAGAGEPHGSSAAPAPAGLHGPSAPHEPSGSPAPAAPHGPSAAHPSDPAPGPDSGQGSPSGPGSGRAAEHVEEHAGDSTGDHGAGDHGADDHGAGDPAGEHAGGQRPEHAGPPVPGQPTVPGQATGPVLAPEPGTDPVPVPEAAAGPFASTDSDEHPHTSYTLRVNGTDRPVTGSWIGESLLYVLRERLGLAGAKDGCSQGECGACNVQVDGRLVASCLVPAATAAGSEVRTVEGLASDGEPSDVQRAMAKCGSVQCGFCIPGMCMTVHDLLEGNHAPTELEARQALAGNLCRCSGYQNVLAAVQEVVAGREAGAAAAHDADGPRIPHQIPPTHDGGMA